MPANMNRSGSISGKIPPNMNRSGSISGKTSQNMNRSGSISGKTSQNMNRSGSTSGNANRNIFSGGGSMVKRLSSSRLSVPEIPKKKSISKTFVQDRHRPSRASINLGKAIKERKVKEASRRISNTPVNGSRRSTVTAIAKMKSKNLEEEKRVESVKGGLNETKRYLVEKNKKYLDKFDEEKKKACKEKGERCKHKNKCLIPRMMKEYVEKHEKLRLKRSAYKSSIPTRRGQKRESGVCCRQPRLHKSGLCDCKRKNKIRRCFGSDKKFANRYCGPTKKTKTTNCCREKKFKNRYCCPIKKPKINNCCKEKRRKAKNYCQEKPKKSTNCCPKPQKKRRLCCPTEKEKIRRNCQPKRVVLPRGCRVAKRNDCCKPVKLTKTICKVVKKNCCVKETIRCRPEKMYCKGICKPAIIKPLCEDGCRPQGAKYYCPELEAYYCAGCGPRKPPRYMFLVRRALTERQHGATVSEITNHIRLRYGKKLCDSKWSDNIRNAINRMYLLHYITRSPIYPTKYVLTTSGRTAQWRAPQRKEQMTERMRRKMRKWRKSNRAAKV